MKCKKNTFIRNAVLPMIVAFIVCGCNLNQKEGDNMSSSNDICEETLEIPRDDYFLAPEAGVVDRDTWNIEMYFLERNEEGIDVLIIDRDNKGFAMDYFFYRLEREDNGSWTRIIYPELSKGIEDLGFYRLSTTNDFIKCQTINYIPDNVHLTAGHYRLTRMLSGRLFSTEFDLPEDVK